MREVEFVSDWLLDKIDNAPAEESFMICTVLWGIWYLRNKKVWEDKVIASAMDETFNILNEWKRFRQSKTKLTQGI